MLDIIVFGAIGIFIVVKLAKKAQEKNEREKFEKACDEAKAAQRTHTEKMLESEFFKSICARIEEANKKHVLSLIESGKQIMRYNAFLRIEVTRNGVCLNGAIDNIVFNELGYLDLTQEEQRALVSALETIGYTMDPYAEDCHLCPNYEYWDKMTGGIVEKHNSKFKTVI